jgi:hypothetical protein
MDRSTPSRNKAPHFSGRRYVAQLISQARQIGLQQIGQEISRLVRFLFDAATRGCF